MTTQRIDSALTRLVDYYIPPDDESSDDHHPAFPNAFHRARHTLETYPASNDLDDAQYMGDLIRRKLVSDNSAPDQAIRFATLYNRLLAHPVLNKKCAILNLLLALAGDTAEASSTPPPTIDRPATADTEPIEEPVQTSFRRSSHRLSVREQLQPAPSVGSSIGGAESVMAEPDIDVKTRAMVLAERGTALEPSEGELLLSLPYTLLGVTSKCIPVVEVEPKPTKSSTVVESTPVKMYELKIPSTLPFPVVSLLHKLAEPALLYKALDEYVQDSPEGAVGGGLVGQSLKSAIGAELAGYVNLIGGLESEIRRAAAAGGSAGQVTLKRCVVWTREATMGLRLMSLIVDKTRGQKGGQLISTIHSFASAHGDPFIHNFAERLLKTITRPFYEMLRHWIYEGELIDPYLEFFVTEDPTISNAVNPHSKGGASSVWQDKYTFTSQQVPTIITDTFANRVFLIGKSLNFIRHGCSDNEWVEDYSKSTSKELRYGDTSKLEMNIDEAYETTMARLIGLMGEKFKLFEHLKALKKFLLLGQGDFIALLMEVLSENLDRPAGALYRHTLTAQLEHAIRGSNAQFDDPEMLGRLDARMLELSTGEVGWDVFTLEYKIDAPVDVVVTPYGSKQYLKIFNFLWRIKRVEYALGTSWRRFMTGARGVLRAVDDILGEDWKRTRCVVAEMVHFVNQLQYYILFEVIESSWTKLQSTINKPNLTLDDLITAHASYLSQITHKGLLGSTTSRPSKKRTAADISDSPDTFLSQLHEILKIMLAYKDAVDGLYGYSVAEFARRQEHAASVEARTAAGQWGTGDNDDNDDTNTGDHVRKNLVERLEALRADFEGRIVVLLGDLAYQPDTDLRLLGVLLSFNEFYPVVNKRRTREREMKRTPRTTAGGKDKKKDVGGETRMEEGVTMMAAG
ncbi:hypothetical protein EX30DRAFT_393032 [Ascodesmis nigricans]|uniref:Uncharacterized protein n=1 Tax=Ascodesmis nigricans TaxID=341454 RepID=A0A4S2N8X8_9PEZI|nr:hypothetical protein EX30DRAFT_393032 [Ascodesmis nigricans]